MKHFFIGSLFILWAFPAWTQSVRVVDRLSLQPLEYVIVSDPQTRLSTQTDEKGYFDLSEFPNSDSLTFSRVGFQSLTQSVKDIRDGKFQVFLSESRLSTFNEVVVSANRWEQNRSEVAQRITSIQVREIAFQNPQTAADLLAATNQVFIQKSQLGGGSPMIRGFATNRVLLVVDGVRMNNAIYRSGNLQNVISLDAASIESAEVIFGPGSVIYGSDAIGGVMDFHTLTPRLAPSGGLRVSGNALARWSSANNERTGSGNILIGGQKWASATSFTYSDFDDLRMGSNGPDDYLRPEYQIRRNGKDEIIPNPDPKVQVPSGYSQWNVLQKLRFRLNEQWDFMYNFQYSTTSDVPRYDRLIESRNNRLRDAEWYYGPQEWMLNSLQITHFGQGGLYNRARLILAYQDYQESRHNRNFGNRNLNHRTENVKAYSANLDFDLNLNTNSSLFYGLEAVYNDVGSTAFLENIENQAISPLSTRYPDGSTWQSYAAYVNYKNNLNQRLTLLAGVRYNHFLLNSVFDKTFYPFPFDDAKINDGAFIGNLGIVLRPINSWQFNLNLSTGFRAPNVDDVGKLFDSAPGNVIVPNPNLTSEYSYNVDLGFIKSFGDKVRLDVTGFYTILDNAIVRRNATFNGRDSIIYDNRLSQVQSLQNVAQARVYGVQAGLEVDLSRQWSFASYLTWNKGEEDDEVTGKSVPLRHAAPLFGNTQLNFQTKRLRLSFYAQYNGEITNEDLAPSEKEKPHLYAKDTNGKPYVPAWMTLNLKGSYQIAPALQVNFGVENITDQRYRPYSWGITAPGRNFIAALRARF